MKVRDIMTRRVVAATPNASCQEIAKKLLSGFFSGMPVVDKNQKVIGVVTEFDLLKAMQKHKEQDKGFCTAVAKDVMTPNPICIDADADIQDAINLMTEHHFIRLPVVEGGKLVGVISRGDILRAFVQDSFVTIQEGEITDHD